MEKENEQKRDRRMSGYRLPAASTLKREKYPVKNKF
jgi:hypothetical protein